MQLLSSFNFIEALFWIFIAALCAVRAFSCKPGFSRFYLIAFAAFIFFGFSDFIEIKTGSWQKPWWLLAWKATCIITIITTYLTHRTKQKKQQH